MTAPADNTLDLLRRWHEGDEQALNELLRRNLPFIRGYLRKRLGARLRLKAETMDFMQDAMVKFLNYGPRFLMGDEGQFRIFMARIIENVLRDKHDWYSARRRDLHRERPLPEGSVLGLDAAARTVTRPSQACARNEEEGWIRLALELMPPDERKLIVLRVYENLSYKEIGERLGIKETTARMRFNHTLPRLVQKVNSLRQGDMAGALSNPLDRIQEKGEAEEGHDS